MKREEVLQNQLDEIMDSFEFDRVYKIMSALDWRWAENQVPDQCEIRKEARRIMKTAINEGGCATGGFRAWVTDGVDADGSWTKLNLCFGIDDCLDGETHE